MAAAGTPVLWHIEVSHYNEKARWALDLKRVPHVRRAPQPALHMVTAWRLTRGATFPVLELEGRAIGDSTRIIGALEARFPEPPLYPADPDARRRALEVEDFFDEQVAPEVRRLVFHHLMSAPGAPRAAAQVSRAGPRRARVIESAFPLLRRAVAGRYGVSADRCDLALTRIRAGLARIEAEATADGHFAGGSFSVADLTAAALLAPLVRPPQFPYAFPDYPPELQALRAELDGPAFDWVRETYARHRPASAEV